LASAWLRPSLSEGLPGILGDVPGGKELVLAAPGFSVGSGVGKGHSRPLGQPVKAVEEVEAASGFGRREEDQPSLAASCTTHGVQADERQYVPLKEISPS
jgi:hypothetical protein